MGARWDSQKNRSRHDRAQDLQKLLDMHQPASPPPPPEPYVQESPLGVVRTVVRLPEVGVGAYTGGALGRLTVVGGRTYTG